MLTGDGSDTAFLTAAFQGADSVYTLLPPDFRATDYRAQQDRQGEAIVKAIRESGVRHVQEQRLRELAEVNVLALRPAFFFWPGRTREGCYE